MQYNVCIQQTVPWTRFRYAWVAELEKNKMDKINESIFGYTKEGKAAKRFLMKNNAGMEVELSDFGASILAIRVPDKEGVQKDILLGYDTVEGYEDNLCGFGAYIGRNANRIGGAKVTLDGVTYELEANQKGINNLHGGSNRSHYKLYSAKCGQEDDGVYVEFGRISPHLEQGFPGNLTQSIRYTLNEENELKISYHMVSDAATVINVTNHSYFNLSGHDSGDILDHELEVYADAFLLTDENLLPTGEVASVEGTPMDFRTMHTVGERIDADYEPLRLAGGYDHNYNLPNDGKQKKAAWVRSPKTGIAMEVYTDLCGMQLYTANFLNNRKGKGGVVYDRRAGICFETQFYPNSCNEPSFPSCVFQAGEVFESATTYKFLLQE